MCVRLCVCSFGCLLVRSFVRSLVVLFACLFVCLHACVCVFVSLVIYGFSCILEVVGRVFAARCARVLYGCVSGVCVCFVILCSLFVYIGVCYYFNTFFCVRPSPECLNVHSHQLVVLPSANPLYIRLRENCFSFCGVDFG